MAYTKQTWATGDIIPAGRMNHIEDGIENNSEILHQTAVPERTVEVAADDLPDYIASLPRLITENLTINVSGTLNNKRVIVRGFYGSGSITIDSSNSATLQSISITYCAIHVWVKHISFYCDISTDSAGYTGIVSTMSCPNVTIEECNLDGGNASEKWRGVTSGKSKILLFNTGISNCGFAAAVATSAGHIIIYTDNAEFKNNNRGAYVYRGGFIHLTGSGTPDTLGGASNTKSGGAILKDNAFI